MPASPSIRPASSCPSGRSGGRQVLQALKRSTPAGAALRIPAGCTGAAPAAPAAAQQQASGDLSGTYRWTITKDDVAASTTEDKSPEHLATFPWVFTMTLDGGKWTLAQREVGQPSTEGPGTYALDGDRLSFTWPQEGSVLTFTVAVDGKGNLHLRPVQPMDAGDQFVWATHPWTRID